jgi:hypothetical protein
MDLDVVDNCAAADFKNFYSFEKIVFVEWEEEIRILLVEIPLESEILLNGWL